MLSDLAIIAAGVIGGLCLLVVCAVYWRSQQFKLDGALLALSGLALLALAAWQASPRNHAVPDLVAGLESQIEAIGRVQAALTAGLEGQTEVIGQLQADLVTGLERQTEAIDQLQAELAVLGASKAVPESAGPAMSEQSAEGPSAFLEIEVLGGVSDEELAKIVAWVGQVKAEHRTSAIFVEPVMPVESTDPSGQRKRLMDEAGKVIDHVFDEINLRLDIVGLVTEPVPGPRLRLGHSEV